MSLFTKRRPYREVTLSSLIKWRDELASDIVRNVRRGNAHLNYDIRKELMRIRAELNYRSEETK
jgi:hypothetical protein